MSKIHEKRESLHKKTQQHATQTKKKGHSAVEKAADKSSKLVHQGIDLAAKTLNDISKSIKEHLPK